MKKKILLFVLLSALLCPLLVSADGPAVAFLDGSGQTPDAYTTLSSAAATLPNGGTIVVCGPTKISSGFNMAASTGKVTLTSLWDGVDYAQTNNAKLTLAYRTSASATSGASVLGVGGETEWNHIVLENGNDIPQMIMARGYKLTIGEGVVCRTVSTSATAYPTLIGCALYAATTKNVNMTIHSGTWNSIYGGNWQGTFTGDSIVTFDGGRVLNTIAGGGYRGGYNGNVVLNIGGNAIVDYNASGCGVVGGLAGISGGTAYPFNGTITLNIYGNAEIHSTVLGSSRYPNIATTADISVNISENAHLYRHVYGGGYGNVTTKENGIRVTISDNVTFTAPSGMSSYICAGANSGTVTGDLFFEIRDNVHIPGNVYGGGYDGNVTGNSTLKIYGGSITVYASAGSRTGKITGNATTECYGGTLSGSGYGLTGNGGTNGTVTGTSTILLDGGTVVGSADLMTAKVGQGSRVILKSGSVQSVVGSAMIDLTGDKSLSVGGNLHVSSLIGGGSLRLLASSAITADSFTGDLALSIAGTPVSAQTYLTVLDPSSAGTVTYISQDDETLTREEADTIRYIITYPERYDTTNIRVYYYNPNGVNEKQPDLVLYSSTASDPNRVKQTLTIGTENGRRYADVTLTPGLYYYKVYYDGANDYDLHYFVVTGKEESHTYDAPFAPYVKDSYMENIMAKTTEEVMETYFNNGDLIGFETAPTPSFTLHSDENDRSFMSNEELCAYIDALNSPYLYRFYFDIGTSYNNRMPVLVFTKDAIPQNASLEEIGRIVRAGGVREIFMIDGGIHGNEPTGSEAALWFATKLCGDYGEDVLDSFGAIVILPDVCPDNHERFKREYEGDNVNPNRDLMALSHPAAAYTSYIYQQFMPTVFVDCHEDGANESIDPADASIANIVDIRFDVAGAPNSAVGDPNGLLAGTTSLASLRAFEMMRQMQVDVAEVGLHTSGYPWAQYNPGVSASYAKVRGSYSFLFEAMRLWTGKIRFERAVFAMETALEKLTALIIKADGEIARDVAAGRAAVPVVTYDPDNLFITKMTTGGDATYKVICPSVYVNGQMKDENHTETIKEYDTPLASRPMATGYVLPADTAKINEILALCGAHGIRYTYIAPDSTLTLRRITLSEPFTTESAANVTFDAGAYVFLTNDENAYLTTYLFEPDSFSTNDTVVTLFQIGLLTSNDALYRSETDYMEAVIVPLTVEGDITGDGQVANEDIALIVRFLAGWTDLPAYADVRADVNRDGKVNNRDAIAAIRIVAGWNDEAHLIGNWQIPDAYVKNTLEIWSFAPNGIFRAYQLSDDGSVLNCIEGSYESAAGALNITMGTSVPLHYTFRVSADGNSLILTDYGTITVCPRYNAPITQ